LEDGDTMEPPTRPRHQGLRHLALNVRHYDEMRHFYTELLGFDVEWEPDPDNLYLSSGIDNLALHRARQPEAANSSVVGAPAPASPLDHFGVIVREAGDVDRWAAFLESRGVVIQAQPRTHRDGARSCYFMDPDGNTVQIIHHPPISAKV
jgi:catechol 2,3-dioxygenase-like lactoylglutathione lyase family enzyme